MKEDHETFMKIAIQKAYEYREPPFWAMKPDKKARFYVYHPDQVYVQNGQYDWGPYLPEDESF